MAMRPLDRLPSIRAKLGSVIVFAVAVTILIMYIAVGFALHRSARDQQFRELFEAAQSAANEGFDVRGRPSLRLILTIAEDPGDVVVVDTAGRRLAGTMAIPGTVERVLDGEVDAGTIGDREFYGVPVVRQDTVVAGLYVAHQIPGGGLGGAVEGTLAFVAANLWQLLLAGAVAASIALFLARILARGMTQPLRDMAEASRQVARGDYGHRVEVRSRDEVGELAEAFNRMAREMEDTERMRRELVANVSHELKTPISALRAHLENLLDGVEEPNPVVLQVMLEQTERLSRLIEQLLDLSRLESGDVPLQLEPVAMADLVDRVVLEVEVARPDRQIVVENTVPRDLPRVEADRERIHQVLFNLLDNAFRFTPSSGHVRIAAVHRSGWCEVSVSDTGVGIPAEHLPHVFERFYRVDPSRSRGDGGTGIGLAIVRSVVEAHGGQVWAESTPGRGATFRFVLPVGGPLGIAERHTEPAAGARRLAGTKV